MGGYAHHISYEVLLVPFSVFCVCIPSKQDFFFTGFNY